LKTLFPVVLKLVTCMITDNVSIINIIPRNNNQNSFLPVNISCKEFLIEGENEILIDFVSPVRWVKEKYKICPTPPNSNGLTGIVHIRKPQYHFGWDWGPFLPLVGIVGNAEIEFVRFGRISDFSVDYEIKNDCVNVSVDTKVEKFYNVDCSVSILCPNGNRLNSIGEKATFTIQNPQLWWTYELSKKEKQPLYKICVELKKNGKVIDKSEKSIGFRTIELRREKDDFGESFQFVLNGVPLFIKGANYIPSDSFMSRVSYQDYEKLLKAVRYSNMNMLRVWGGGFYASEELLTLCDEMGILIWQDFMYACQAYPFFDENFLNNVLSETKYQVKRISSHASLALFCGNNEIEAMYMSWLNMPNYIKWTEKFFHHILPDEIRKYDKKTPYIPGSPIGTSHNENVNSDRYADTHIWAVWHGLKPMNYYRQRMTRFCSEFGFESLPDLKTIAYFGSGENFSVNDEYFLSHQKCLNGNDKMLYYCASRFGLPKQSKDLVYLSQITQSECISDATEHWRRNRHRCYGSMYWQLNDCWPVCSWSSYDYFGNYKALQYEARKFNAPLCISAQDTDEYIRVFVINDLNEDKNVKILYEVFDFSAGIKEKAFFSSSVSATESKIVLVKSMEELKKKYDLRRTGLRLTLFENENAINTKTVLFDREKNLCLPKSKLTITFSEKSSYLDVSVSTDTYSRLVKVESNLSSNPFDDNFFDLLPNEEKTVKIYVSPDLTMKELKDSIKVYSLTDIEFDKLPINILKNKIKIWSSFTNIANALWHGREPK